MRSIEGLGLNFALFGGLVFAPARDRVQAETAELIGKFHDAVAVESCEDLFAEEEEYQLVVEGLVEPVDYLLDEEESVMLQFEGIGQKLSLFSTVEVFEEDGAVDLLLVLVGPGALLWGPAAGGLLLKYAKELLAVVFFEGVKVAAG